MARSVVASMADPVLQAASLRADLRDVFVQNGQECRSLALVQLDGGDDVEHMLSILRLGRLWGHCTVPDRE